VSTLSAELTSHFACSSVPIRTYAKEHFADSHSQSHDKFPGRYFHQLKQIELPPRGLETLFGVHDQNIKYLESLLDVQINGRGHSLNVDGDPKDVEVVERILEDVSELFREGAMSPASTLRDGPARARGSPWDWPGLDWPRTAYSCYRPGGVLFISTRWRTSGRCSSDASPETPLRARVRYGILYFRPVYEI